MGKIDFFWMHTKCLKCQNQYFFVKIDRGKLLQENILYKMAYYKFLIGVYNVLL